MRPRIKGSDPGFSRRGFLKLAGAAGAGLALAGCDAQDRPLRSDETPPLDAGAPFLGLATSLNKELDYAALVEGTLPHDLRGTLYRNGPGLFDRGGRRKRCILDGDGMIQAVRMGGGEARYRNRFVRTEKFVTEEKAGRFLHETWTTQAPGGWLANLGANIANQAGISVIRRGDTLYAFDESAQPYALNAETLETIGESRLGLEKGKALYAAHWKVDGATGEWIHFGIEYGSDATLHITQFNKDGSLRQHRALEMPRYSYMHDFFVSERHIVFNILPIELSISQFLLGRSSFAGTMRWRPQRGNILLVIAREGDAKPLRINAEPRWMWHALNAWERAGEIVADFVGYRDPRHFIGKSAGLYAIMAGEAGTWGAPGDIRRYVIDLKRKRVKEDVVVRGNHEFPYVNPRVSCNRHRYGYVAAAGSNAILFSAVMRVDMETGARSVHDFGAGHFCGEPVFAPRPHHYYGEDPAREPGWILTEVYNGHTRDSYVAVLDAEAVSRGPLALIHLNHHVPLSLHGSWHAEA